MTILIILAIYALGVLYSRWLNKILVKQNKYNPIWSWLWFIPIIGPLGFTIFWVGDNAPSFSEKYEFFGKGWRK